MTALLTLLVVIGVSLLITRIATLALAATGLSTESARFQARSAFSGAGFTTHEAENVVGHPVRRRIIMLLMLLGNAGFVTVVSTLILTFVNTRGPRDWGPRFGVLVFGLALLWFAARSRPVERAVDRLIRSALDRFTDLDVRDYAGLLHLARDYHVGELVIEPGDWIAGRALADLQLSEEGLLVLGIERPSGGYLGAPRGNAVLEAGDTLIVYGRDVAITELDRRPAGSEGDEAHQRAVAEQEAVEREEEEELKAAEGDGNPPPAEP
ncbi:MAG TPA: TrkA C-terminal domain-containing protein [Thermoanaerobaculia bacterium]|nr:TrkA C-terminal domain-containing protein [Thermoanaerobaculia bacterium]